LKKCIPQKTDSTNKQTKESERIEIFTAVIMRNGVIWDDTRVALVRTDVSEELSASLTG
jgi:hypothetical protein